MIQVAMVDSFGEIKYIVSAANDGTYGDGEAVGDLTAHHISADIEPSSFIRDNYWDGTNWQAKPVKPGEFYYWSTNFKWAFNSEVFMAVIRRDRDQKLYACDWTQLPDANVDSAAWATYRQALRDFPSTITTETSMEELIWPTEP